MNIIITASIIHPQNRRSSMKDNNHSQATPENTHLAVNLNNKETSL